MKILRALFTVLIIMGLAYGGYLAYANYFPKKKTLVQVPTRKVMKGEFVLKVTEIGKVKARKSIFVSAPFAGKILKLTKEGSIVKKGDFLAQMDTTELLRKVSDQTLEFQQCEADVKKAEEELRIMKVSSQLDLKQKTSQLEYDKSELEDAKRKLARQQRLFKEMIVTRQNVEDEEVKVRSRELAVKKGKVDVDIARRKNLSDEIKKKAEINILKIKAKKKKLDMDAAKEDLANGTINAPADGLVVYQNVWRTGQMGKLSEGDDVHKRANIMEIPDLQSLLVLVPVRETDIHRVRVGEEALIKLEADPNSLFHGRVEKIDRIAKEADPWDNPTTPGQKTFEVTIGLKERDPARIRPGMTANCDIIEKKIPGALSLPIESVFYQEGKKFVFIKGSDGYVRREVEVGARNENFVVITKGLTEKDEVTLRNPTRITAGPGGASKPLVKTGAKKEPKNSPVNMVPKK